MTQEKSSILDKSFFHFPTDVLPSDRSKCAGLDVAEEGCAFSASQSDLHLRQMSHFQPLKMEGFAES